MQTFTIPVPALTRSFWRHRHLIGQMVWREVVGRYRGSLLGLLWSFFHPVVMLAVYTFVFSVVFQVRWGAGGTSKAQFAVVLFAGLMMYNFFAEIVNRAPGLILGQVNLVKKVVFPLEILPVVAVGAALFHTLVSVAVLLLFQLAVHLHLPYTVIFWPLLLLPFGAMVLGCAWFLAGLGVYLRDVVQTVGLLTTALLFLSPIFYPLSALPAGLRGYLLLNPLTFIVEETRKVLLWGEVPDWSGLLVYTGASVLLAGAGLLWFQKARRGFADVL